jgi:putative endonuclease
MGVIPGCYTLSRLPVKLVYTQEFSRVEDAIAFEKQVKGWARRRKESLIKGDIQALKRFSRSHGSSGSP